MENPNQIEWKQNRAVFFTENDSWHNYRSMENPRLVLIYI